MIQTTIENHIETWIPATLSSVDLVCQQIRGFLGQHHLDYLFFEISLVAREALVNAVVHGCGNDPQQKVRFDICIEQDEMIMDIEDPGEGFDWKQQMKARADLADTHGRGMAIYEYYCKCYEFNNRGNRVRLIKTLAR